LLYLSLSNWAVKCHKIILKAKERLKEEKNTVYSIEL